MKIKKSLKLAIPTASDGVFPASFRDAISNFLFGKSHGKPWGIKPKMKMNKKGFLKIVEVSISIFIIAAAILVSFDKTEGNNEVDYSEMARDILFEISDDEPYRSEVFKAPLGEVLGPSSLQGFIGYIDGRMPDFLDFEVRVCQAQSVCGISNHVGNVYSAERIISSDISSLIGAPVKIRLFIWEKAV